MKNIPISVLDLKSLKCVIVDEYQDFSTLFYRIIQAISKYNHDFKLFVVGDDWQSINQFAGADIKYFFQFQERFDNVPTAEKALNTNYRSRETIVEFGNLLMSELGHLAIPSKNNL